MANVVHLHDRRDPPTPTPTPPPCPDAPGAPPTSRTWCGRVVHSSRVTQQLTAVECAICRANFARVLRTRPAAADAMTSARWYCGMCDEWFTRRSDDGDCPRCGFKLERFA